VQRLLLEAPALPQPAAASLFRDLLRAGPAWVNTALSTVLAGITARPPDRWGITARPPDRWGLPLHRPQQAVVSMRG